ncbi:MAG TPA: TetR/AcrR family transcriptional regulator [Steroidobacteraceae bacterium]|nr:TetR/AcrR family transcriptional regulator [Steroidobacteraceae bacterium]
MKTKTEVKRQAILNAAAEVFREMGFERASMSDIRARTGGSKATLYNYFPSKEKLFFEVMHKAKAGELEEIVGGLNPEAEDFKQQLLDFGKNLLVVLYSPEAMAIRHLTIAESRHSDIGKLSFEQAAAPIESRVADFLRRGMKRRAIRTADPKIAAMHLLSLLESELMQRFLLGMLDPVKPETITSAVRRAVEVFISGYARR